MGDIIVMSYSVEENVNALKEHGLTVLENVLTTEEIDIIVQCISQFALEEVETTSVVENTVSKKIIKIPPYASKIIGYKKTACWNNYGFELR